MLDGQLILSGTAQKDANTISEKFAVLNVKADGDRTLFADLVAFNGNVERLSGVKEGEKIRVLCHPESHKGRQESATWRIRFVIDEWIDPEPDV
jgi:hypothetical protein